ncbi:SAVED domain-containing protein [Intestinibacter bartlettii]|uniref:SAVED domain-containing protein n=1 Tax=Intestinibacter bartlettii TaxID=261299 RepID=A0ABS6DXK6_9FIRM|nr:SAVED domain-containing protein [Intestinibacter bartlettii]MBU5336580.1 SAVED domain-containing protein [Intestinibacter bartlettii]
MKNVYMGVFIVIIIVWIILNLIFKFIGEKETNIAKKISGLGISIIGCTIPGISDSIIEIVAKLFNVETQGISNVYIWWIFGGILIIIGIILNRDIKDRVFILNMFGIFSQLEISDVQNIHDLKISDFKVKEIIIDFVDTFKSGINDKSNELIVKKIKDECKKFSNRSKDFVSCYTGMGPIPYTILAGTYLADSKVERYFEYKRSENKYYELKNKKYRKNSYQELKEEFPTNKRINSKKVVVSISITRKVEDFDLVQFTNQDIIKLYVDNPCDNLITSKDQLYDYKEKICFCLEKIKTYYNQVETINLVASIPSCISLEIGKLISLNNNRLPEIVSYHYNNSSVPKYEFGIVVTENPTDNKKGKLIT